MPNDAYEHMKMVLNVNKNAKIVIESELRANVRFLELMNASSRYWSSIHANDCVSSRNEQQKVYYLSPLYCFVTCLVHTSSPRSLGLAVCPPCFVSHITCSLFSKPFTEKLKFSQILKDPETGSVRLKIDHSLFHM